MDQTRWTALASFSQNRIYLNFIWRINITTEEVGKKNVSTFESMPMLNVSHQANAISVDGAVCYFFFFSFICFVVDTDNLADGENTDLWNVSIFFIPYIFCVSVCFFFLKWNLKDRNSNDMRRNEMQTKQPMKMKNAWRKKKNRKKIK